MLLDVRLHGQPLPDCFQRPVVALALEELQPVLLCPLVSHMLWCFEGDAPVDGGTCNRMNPHPTECYPSQVGPYTVTFLFFLDCTLSMKLMALFCIKWCSIKYLECVDLGSFMPPSALVSSSLLNQKVIFEAFVCHYRSMNFLGNGWKLF